MELRPTSSGAGKPGQALQELDERLFVRLPDGRTGLLLGNPHTFPGHFNVLTTAGEVITCALYEIISASQEAEYWLQGYLAGSEPDPSEIWGSGTYELDDQGPELSAWRVAAERFRRTGKWGPNGFCPRCGRLRLPSATVSPCGVCGAMPGGETLEGHTPE
jgi:hypothetical protein